MNTARVVFDERALNCGRQRSLRRLICLTFLALTAPAGAATDDGAPDSLRIAMTATQAGCATAVAVTVFNDNPLAGSQVPLYWGNGELYLDSVSFIGGALGGLLPSNRPVSIDNVAHKVIFGHVAFDPSAIIGAGDRLWATLWFSVAGGAAPQLIDIDSTRYGLAETRLLFIDSSGMNSFTPQFLAGEVELTTAADVDGDGLADVCDPCPQSAISPCCCNLAGDFNNSGAYNIGDITAGIAYIFNGGPEASCRDEADFNGDSTYNIADVTAGIAHIFSSGPAPLCGMTGL